MAHIQIQDKQSKQLVHDITEETFLKELYMFMKKRNTPIEKVPHLGFKQIDLFLMFKTVKKLGGYKQVTGQQLWKQVYNTLGGNPRSTSAATCTRRHYEKLLLPYECHVTGQVLKVPPRPHLHHFHYTDFTKDGDRQRPQKRKLMPMLLHHHNPHNLSSEPHSSSFPLPFQYPPYYNPGQPALPTYVHTPSSELNPHSPPALQHQPLYHSSCSNLDDRIREPLEHLRYLAEQYKSSSGLAEPLNLSCKSTNRDTPASSFAPPPSSKNPKFLNKPSPLYPTNRVSRNEGHDTKDSEANLEVTPCSSSPKAMEECVENHNLTTSSNNLTYVSTPAMGTETSGLAKHLKINEEISAVAHKSSPPKTDFTIHPIAEKELSPQISQKECDLSPLQTRCTQENEGIMEIEVPLGVLQKWIRMFKPPVTLHEAKQQPAPTQEEQKNYCATEMFPTNLTLNIHSQPQQSNTANEDPRLRQRNEPSPPPTIQPSNNHDMMNHYDFKSYRSLSSGSSLRIPASHDLYTFDQQANNTPYSSKLTSYWDAYDRESQVPLTKQIIESSSNMAHQDFATSKFSVHPEDTAQRSKERADVEPSALLMLNSSSGSVVHLTSEELMKLKKIISSPS